MKTTAILTATLSLMLGSLHAQSVPLFMNYQGTVTDSAGLGLGTVTPVNRKVIFRIFDAATGGKRLWSEQHTVTISDGQFSVLLGNGINANYAGVDEVPLKTATPLDTVFTSAGILRYVEIVVDDGDNMLDAADAPIAPRQQITSTAYSFRARSADTIASGSDLQLNGSANYGLGYYGATRLFNGAAVDGPVLFGQAGGALGSVNGGTKNIALRWNAAGAVGIGSADLTGAAATTKLVLQGDDANTVPLQLNIRGNSDTNKRLLLGYNTTTNPGYGSLQAYSAASTTTNLRLNPAGGNVSIGTSNPGAYKLDVNGTLRAGAITGTGTITGTSFSGSGAGLTALNAANVVTGTLSDTRLSSNIVRKDSTSNVFTGTITGTSFSGSGAGLTALNAANVVTGTLSDTRLSSNIVRKDSTSNVFTGTITGTTTKLVLQGNDASTFPLQLNIRGTDNDKRLLLGYNTTNNYGSIQAYSTPTNKAALVLNPDGGRVGIGTTNPNKARLEIASANQNTLTGRQMQSTGESNVTGLQTDFSIYAVASIAAERFLAFSDRRIKLIEGRSDAARDLEALTNIEITDYSYIDTVSKGTAKQKKVIAQQVEKVYPQAVSRSTDEVPDIYRKAAVKDGWVLLETNLKKGERVSLMGEKNKGVHEVLEVAEGKFRTDFVTEGDVVFVYGREVNDFLSVDYEAIAMLNVSATQQIKMEKDAEVKALRKENSDLRERIATLEDRDKARDGKIAAIEKLLESTDQPVLRTISLKAE